MNYTNITDENNIYHIDFLPHIKNVDHTKLTQGYSSLNVDLCSTEIISGGNMSELITNLLFHFNQHCGKSNTKKPFHPLYFDLIGLNQFNDQTYLGRVVIYTKPNFY